MARSVPYCIGYLKLKWLAVNTHLINIVDAFEEEDFDEDFDKAVNEVTAIGGIYNCIECKKAYNTLGCLQRHNKARHTENNSEGKRLLLDKVVLTYLLKKAAEIYQRMNVGARIREEVFRIFVALLMGSSLKKFQSCVQHL